MIYCKNRSRFMNILVVDVGGTSVKILVTGDEKPRSFPSGLTLVDGIVEPMELGHLPYRKGTFEDYVGKHGLVGQGKKKWRQSVADVVARLVAALEPDDVVLGGGNVKNLKDLPPGCRAGRTPTRFRAVSASGGSRPGSRGLRLYMRITIHEDSSALELERRRGPSHQMAAGIPGHPAGGSPARPSGVQSLAPSRVSAA